MKITVYLASSMGNPIYRDSVEAFGDWMAQKGYDLVYGGSQTGLMGLLADRVLAHGGKVYGIMPDFLQKREEVHQGLTQLRIVADMDERRRLLMEMGDVLVAFPGGLERLKRLVRRFLGRAWDNTTSLACFLMLMVIMIASKNNLIRWCR